MMTTIDAAPQITYPTNKVSPLSVLSLGFGQDSIAILLRIGKDAAFRRKYAPGKVLAIFAATGDEHAETYALVPFVETFCAEHDIEFVNLTFDKGFHSGPWSKGLQAFYESNAAIGSQAYPKSCSENLKIAPIYRYLAKRIAIDFFDDASLAKDKNSLYLYEAAYGKLPVLIGIAKGEESRVEKTEPKPCAPCKGVGLIDLDTRCKACSGTGFKKPRAKWLVECVERRYPLIDVGVDRSAAQAYIASITTAKVSPSNCYMCPFKSPIEILWSWMIDPDRFAVWVALEARKIAANTHMNAVVNPKTGRPENKNFGVFKTKLLPQVLAEAQVKYAGWSREQIEEYRFSHGHCVASTY